MSYFTTAGTINANILGYQLSGTGPHYVAEEHLDVVTDTLTAGGETCSALTTRVQTITLDALDANLNMPVWVPDRAIVVSAVKLVTSASVVGQATNSTTLTLYNKGLVGTALGTVAQMAFVAAAGTAGSNVPYSLTISNGTVAISETLAVSFGTIGSGLHIPASLLMIEYAV